MDKDNTFAESLKEILELRGLSSRALEKSSGISKSAINAWRNDAQSIKLSNLVKLANFLECSIDYLLGLSDDAKVSLPRKIPHFGKHLRELMKKKGVTTYKLRLRGFGSNSLRRWDSGADPTLETLIKLSDILDCTVDTLIGYS